MWEQRFIETTRGVFELFECGEGAPIAITHLYSAFDERGYAFASPFTEHYKVFLINLRGAGNSVKAEYEDQYSLDETVLDLESIRLALNLEKWAFAGHSTGGMLALKYAILKPSSLDKIIAGGAAASVEYGEDPSSIYCPQNLNYERIIEIMDSLNDGQTPIEERRKMSKEWALMSFYREESLEKSYARPNSGRTVGERLTYFRAVECQSYDLRKELPNVQVQAYIYAGKYDAQCPYKFGVEIAELLPQATFTTFEESNHFPYFEEEEMFNLFVENSQ